MWPHPWASTRLWSGWLEGALGLAIVVVNTAGRWEDCAAARGSGQRTHAQARGSMGGRYGPARVLKRLRRREDLTGGAAVGETGGDSGSEAEVTGSEARARRSTCYMAPWLLSGFLYRERERKKMREEGKNGKEEERQGGEGATRGCLLACSSVEGAPVVLLLAVAREKQ